MIINGNKWQRLCYCTSFLGNVINKFLALLNSEWYKLDIPSNYNKMYVFSFIFFLMALIPVAENIFISTE